jgi:protein involved in polysaccharide export with SLBB domain
MIAAITQNIKNGRIIAMFSKLGVGLAFCLLFSGCVTSSLEDDYVANVLAEAMQDYGAVGTLPAPTAEPPPLQGVSLPQPGAVSMTVPSSVSVPAGGTVSVAQPSPVIVMPTSAVAPVAPPASSQGVVVPAIPAPVVAVPAVYVPVSQPPPVAAPPPVAPPPLVEGAPVVAPVPVQVVGVGTNEGATPVMPRSMESKPVVPRPSVATIQPDSVLWVSVTEDPSLSGRYMVNDASAIDFGYVGLVFLPDLSVEQAEAEIKRVLEGRYLKNATVSVKLAKASYDRITVSGHVEMPGEIKIGPGATISLNEALRRAGGLRASRDHSRVKIVRGGVKTPFGAAAEGEVYPLTTQEGQLKVPDLFLRNDDLVYVFTPSSEAKGANPDSVITGVGGKRVILLGEVPRRGVIEFSENEPCTLMYLLFKIGGLPRFARGDRITVVRRNKDGQEQKFLVNGEKLMKSGKPEDDLVLESGDRIVVPARSISFL